LKISFVFYIFGKEIFKEKVTVLIIPFYCEKRFHPPVFTDKTAGKFA